MILVTGGAGFIGSNFIHDWLAVSDEPVLNLDALTYAGSTDNLASLQGDPRHVFVHGNICDRAHVERLLEEYRPSAVVHFAAETHADRSIWGPELFFQTNVQGTLNLLQCAKSYFDRLQDGEQKRAFRFLHVSTDEVYGSLEKDEPPFTEETPYRPNSPYSASKASSDHAVRAWHRTYGFPTITTNCSNNYGPYQFPEKLIPLVISNALQRKALPIYGDGRQVRDWLFVTDHCRALRTVLTRGRVGESYNIGASNERSNLEIVRMVCRILDELIPHKAGSYAELISFVTDRPGHDRRYAINAAKLRSELGWRPETDFETGLRQTILWYLKNTDWLNRARSGDFQEWERKQYKIDRLASRPYTEKEKGR